MKVISLLMLIGLSAIAAEPVTVTLPRESYKIYPNGKVEFLNDVKPEEVVRTLTLMNQQCGQELNALKALPTGKFEKKHVPEDKKGK